MACNYYNNLSISLHYVLVFISSLIDTSKKTKRETSKNQFLVMYWYKIDVNSTPEDKLVNMKVIIS